MKGNARQKIIAVVTFLGGIYFFLEFVLPKTFFGVEIGKYNEQISRGMIVVSSMAIGLGLINILRVHGIVILKGRKGWYNSVALLVGLFVMFLFQGIDFIQSEKSVASWKQISDLALFSEVIVKENANDPKKAIARLETAVGRLEQVAHRASSESDFLSMQKSLAKQPKLAESFRETLAASQASLQELIASYRLSDLDQRAAAHAAFEESIASTTEAAQALAAFNYSGSSIKKAASLLFNGFFAPLGAAMFSLLAFYIATAAYRTFRVRSIEAAIMMFAALFVMLGQMPHGPTYVSESLPDIRRWLLLNLSTPAFRAIFFGATIAGLAMATRMWLSLEDSPLSSDQGGD